MSLCLFSPELHFFLKTSKCPLSIDILKMVCFPKEIFSSILEFCDTRDFDKHKQVWKYISVEIVYDDPDCPDFYDDAYAVYEPY
jgi:hypothetical protein